MPKKQPRSITRSISPTTRLLVAPATSRRNEVKNGGRDIDPDLIKNLYLYCYKNAWNMAVYLCIRCQAGKNRNRAMGEDIKYTINWHTLLPLKPFWLIFLYKLYRISAERNPKLASFIMIKPCNGICLLYTSPSPRDRQKSRMPSSA